MAQKTFEILRDKIVTKLQAISDIQEVKTDPDPDINGFPATTVYPTTQDSDFQNVAQNERIYTFIVAVFYETQHTSVGNALIAMYDTVDQVLDSFDQDPLLSGISLPSGKNIIDITPVPSEWGELPEKELLKIDVTLNIRITSNIS